MFEDIHVPDAVQLPKGKRACRRKADELRTAYQLHRKFAAFAEEAEELPDRQALPGQRKLFDVAELAEKREWLKDLSGDNQQALLKSLNKLEKAGPWRNVAKAVAPQALDSLHADFPNFSAVKRVETYMPATSAQRPTNAPIRITVWDLFNPTTTRNKIGIRHGTRKRYRKPVR